MQEDIFTREQSQIIFGKFYARMSSLTTTSDFEIARNSHISLIINAIRKNPEIWNRNCQLNITWIGEHFINRLSNENEDLTKAELDDIFSICFRFLFEFYLSIKNELSMEFERARRFASESIDNFEISAKNQIEYAIREMPISILKALLNNDEISNIRNHTKNVNDSLAMQQKWDEELSAKESRVDALKEILDKHESAFNFVGLHQGFDDLSRNKKAERKNLLRFLIALGIIIPSLIFVEIFFIISNATDLKNIKDILILTIIPTISFIGLLLYYFRILLFNFNSVKSQLLQLELRKTLCSFIQNYAEYAEPLKAKDKEALAKFENIIFSGIVTNDDKLPSTFDGAEQLVNLIKSVKG